MIDHLKRRLEGKTIALLGFGREGQSSYSLLRRIFPGKRLVVADANPAVAENPLLRDDRQVMVISGPGYLERLAEYDVVFRSPGIPVWPLLSGEKPLLTRLQITSQTELFLERYAGRVIGITGTKGKSTTTTLIHHILKTAGKEVLLAGNIGNPVFHLDGMVGKETLVVLELSSHQLEFITRAPHTAVFLNLFQEHLDAYPSYEAYQQAKLNITRYQAEGDVLVFNQDDPLVSGLVEPFVAHRRSCPFTLEGVLTAGGYRDDGWICFADRLKAVPVWQIHQDRFLRGEHNLKNIMAAVNVAMTLGIGPEDIADGIATFKGLEHRLEYVGEYRKIHFYNDSIATIPEACMEAVKAIPGVDTLVAGGFDRGIDYTALGVFLAASTVRNFILTGEAGQRIGRSIGQAGNRDKQIFYIPRFAGFRDIAFRETREGGVCLLSPAAASYDEFRNFEERGKMYRSLIQEGGAQ